MFKKNAWNKYENKTPIMEFNEGYKNFISKCKTERLCVKEAIKILESKGFKNINDMYQLNPGDKVYFVNKDKNVAAYVIGYNPIQKGIRILGAHIDSPRLDLKQNPLYEKDGFALLDTHYYGGIKKYQWVTIPLALVGVIVKKNGEVIEVNIGDKDDDPVFGISDLLPHLAADQMDKKSSKLIEGENLDVTFASIPLNNTDKKAVKANVLKMLMAQYGIDEEDFTSAEIEVVPAGKARDYGFDRSMIMGYGHDDRSCAYTSLMAICDIENPEYTACCILVDKEEIGSVGATGAHSYFFENTILEIVEKTSSSCSLLQLRKILEKSMMLSSDVSAGYDPLFSSVYEDENSAFLGNGIVFNKYTGARGKSGSNDCNAEYFAQIRDIMDSNKINYQTAELGKVDQGGGGTIAYILGNMNMNVVDAGIAVLNMHAPCEIVSKVDVYEAYLAYKAFLTK